MKFVCMGFIDESRWENLSEEEAGRLMKLCLDYDDELRRGGHFLGGEAMQPGKSGVTLNWKDGKVDVQDGPFPETKEVLGGILLLEARDLSHAIALMSKHPGVKMGPFEIRPVDEVINQIVAERSQKFRV